MGRADVIDVAGTVEIGLEKVSSGGVCVKGSDDLPRLGAY